MVHTIYFLRLSLSQTTQDVHEMGHPPGGGQEACYQFVSRQAMDGKFTFVDQRFDTIINDVVLIDV